MDRTSLMLGLWAYVPNVAETSAFLPANVPLRFSDTRLSFSLKSTELSGMILCDLVEPF